MPAKIMRSEDFVQQVIHLYNLGESALKISKKLKLGSTSVYRILDKNNVERRKQLETSRKYAIKGDYFNTIDDNDKAYILGLICADGCNTLTKERSVLRINLAIKDIDILEKIRDVISPNSPIAITKNTPPRQDSCLLALYSKNLVEGLNKLGVTNNKTYELEFPFIEDRYYSHFIRGYFDGDGSIMVGENGNFTVRIDITGRIGVVKNIQDILVKELNINRTKILKDSKSEVVHHLKYGGFENCTKIRAFMYKDANLYINRKHKLFHSF